jgi:hypothetical protein
MDRVRLGVLLALVLLAGCGASRRSRVTSSEGEGGAPSELPPPGTAGANGGAAAGGAAGAAGASTSLEPVAAMAAWRTRLAAAECARELRCGSRWANEEDCVEDAETWPAYVRFFGGIDEDEYLASTHTLAPSALLDACIDAVTRTRCDDARSSYEACAGVLVAKAPRQSGEPCVYASPYVLAPACAPGLVCSEPYGCGVCVPLPPPHAEGETCTRSEDCAPGLVCLASTCRASSTLSAEGEPCDGARACRADLTCAFDSQRCVRLNGENEPCDPDAYSCANDLTCVTDASTGEATCRAHARRGDACSRVATYGDGRACNRSNWCVFATPDAPAGTCGVAPAAPGPCALFADDSSYFCPAGTYPDVDLAELAPPAACTCKPDLELGARCRADVQCGHGYCATDRDGDDGRCAPLLPDGASCTPDDGEHCASLHGCDADSGTCSAECSSSLGP